ncbi:hypothetical protein jhhlp_004009 [Lomentospora prolificans]|uniref:CFEM domain-containing protein n=1 Tax=Lomentospora prolificans TaxID=41688 RepID=A0A2N3NAE3_9PEZI|nr:hypothetical protein jhhlp_004009 [Lomentospora prolificans]
MKTTALLVLAAGVGETVATFGGFGGFRGANPFTCPDNTDNSRCEDKQRGGFDFSDLLPGQKDFTYGGFKFNGFECKDDRRNRRELSGDCGPDKNSNPFFGRDSENFSISEIEIYTEFDTDLEFVYEMPNGGQCKHRSSCSSKGSTVKNTQCGGAKKVTVVHPKQNNKPKSNCGIRIPNIKFDCNPPKTTNPPKSTTPPKTNTPEVPETTVPEVPETTETPEVPETTVPEVPETTVPEVPETTVVTSSSPESSSPAEEESSTVPEVPETTEVPGTTVTSSSPEEGSSTVVTETSESPEQPETTAPPEVETTITSHLTTSTIFTTIVSTVTDCGPSVTDCPADQASTVIVTATVPLTTTVCPVTETITRTKDTPQDTPSSVISNSPIVSSVTPPGPVETLPCPEVVPSCLNTWLFSVGCSDNTDTACFCPDTAFVQNIFTCIYAYGETDTIISEAIVFFQGICGGHIPENPAIVTGIDSITSVITEAPKPTVPAGYATVTVTVTTVVPCVTDGVTISGSSTTTVIEQTAEIPNVGFQTNTEGNVNVVPTTPAAIVNPSPSATATPIGTFVSVPVPAATGTQGSSPSTPSTPVVVAGASKVASGLGLGLAAVAALALF